MAEQDYIQFEDYLLGNLDEEAVFAFEKQLKTDVEFQKAFNIYKDVSIHLDYNIRNEEKSTDFKANLDAISHNYFNSEKTKAPPKKSRIFRLSQLAIVAIVAIFLGVYAYNQFSTPNYLDYNNFETISLTIRSAEEKLKTRAENAFNSKNYKEAELLFNQILKEEPTNLEVVLYKSIILIETNQFSEADKLLIKLSKTNSAYKNKAKWYWALNKLKQKNYKDCIKVLKTISKDAEDYKETQKLLKKLN